MSRKLTTYKRPSIRDLIAHASDIDVLAGLRVQLNIGLADGRLEPAEKTLLEWERALWQRAFELLAGAPTASVACYTYNRMIRWRKSPEIAEVLEKLLAERVAQLPDDVELAAQAGVIIEGVSTPDQVTRAIAARRQEAAA